MSRTIFANASVLDVVRGDVLPGRTVVVEGGRIVEIGERAVASAEGVLDLSGRVLMPGLCDAHVHVIAATPDFAAIERWSPSYVAAHASRILRDMLQRGFTTVRDVGGADHGLAQALSEGLFVGPRLLFGGKAISQTGGHGDMRLPGELHLVQCPCCSGLGRICDGVAEVRRGCRDEIRKGANHIKLMVSGGVSSPTDRITSTQFAEDELVAAVQEAEAAGIYCAAHAYTPRSIRRAVLAGVRSIEHGNLLDAPTAALMAEHGAFLVPTLVTYEALARWGVEAGLPPAMLPKLDQVLAAGLQALKLAVEAGVEIVYGSDLLGSMHKHQLDEFRLRSQVQAPIEVIRSATVNASRLFHMEGEIGVVAEGAYADLLVLDGDPTQDLSVLYRNRPQLVMRAGEVVVGGC